MSQSTDRLEPTGSADRTAAQRVLDLATSQGVEFIHLQFTDIPGSIKGLSLPVERLAVAMADGIWFDGSSVEGFARLAESDLYLRPDTDELCRHSMGTPTHSATNVRSDDARWRGIRGGSSVCPSTGA